MADPPAAGHPRMPRRPGTSSTSRDRTLPAGVPLLIDYAVLLISVAGSAIIHSAVDSATTSAAGGLQACPLVTFLLYLLGLLLVMLALVADLF
ncbi:hypothetical protein BAE44_0012020 [Dichanthelium oligosanthes]|uniref:Uncharacterized protein n=1 Tax=Dichanthelium oligosanthes TaxID=888268 RepID=A0A1E5VPC3_9POAL|nr:hypothetical protein BAE44_0012020 [Dichanthelium oligosanthes]